MEPNYLVVLRPVRIGMLTDGPTAAEAAIVARHLEYLQAQARAGKVRLAGRTTEDDDRTLGLVLLAAVSKDEAQAIMNADPAVAQGVMRAELHPFRLAVSA
jgi:uncharacterized protein YciI